MITFEQWCRKVALEHKTFMFESQRFRSSIGPPRYMTDGWLSLWLDGKTLETRLQPYMCKGIQDIAAEVRARTGRAPGNLPLVIAMEGFVDLALALPHFRIDSYSILQTLSFQDFAMTMVKHASLKTFEAIDALLPKDSGSTKGMYLALAVKNRKLDVFERLLSLGWGESLDNTDDGETALKMIVDDELLEYLKLAPGCLEHGALVELIDYARERKFWEGLDVIRSFDHDVGMTPSHKQIVDTMDAEELLDMILHTDYEQDYVLYFLESNRDDLLEKIGEKDPEILQIMLPTLVRKGNFSGFRRFVKLGAEVKNDILLPAVLMSKDTIGIDWLMENYPQAILPNFKWFEYWLKLSPITAYFPAMELMLKKYPDVLTEKDLYIGLDLAVKHQNLELVQFLLKQGISPNGSKHTNALDPLFVAIQNQDMKIVRALLNHKYDFLENPLFYASKVGSEEIFMLLLEQQQCSLAKRDEDGKTMLHICAERGFFRAVSALVEFMDLDLSDNNGDTPLRLASKHRHRDIVHLLFQRGASLRPK